MERTTLPGAPDLDRAHGGPARRSGIRQQLRLGVGDLGGRGFRRRRPYHHDVVLPAGVLPVAAALRGMDPAFEEMSRALGNSASGTSFRVVLPQLRPALLGGVLLVGLHLLADFGALRALRFPTFTTAIYDQFESTFNGPASTMLAAVLVIGCLLLLLGELRLAGRVRVARVGAGAARAAVSHPLGVSVVPALAGMAALEVLALGVPLVSLTRWLGVGSSTEFPLALLATTAATSIGLGAAGAAATCLLAVPVGVAVGAPSRLGEPDPGTPQDHRRGVALDATHRFEATHRFQTFA
ncbi:ABC transporter permease subunit [Pseudonocardia saturnea]